MTDTILTNILGNAYSHTNRETLRKAHAAAAEFHAAMAAVIEADAEISEPDSDALAYWQKQRQEQLGAAMVAMEKVPVIWLSMLGIKI